MTLQVAAKQFDDHTSHLDATASSCWKAELELAFEAGETRTRLIRRRQYGPLVVQRPFYPEPDGTCHVYLLHPPAGIAGGDDLLQTFDVGAGARCMLTTPGATKFYRSALDKSMLRNVVGVAAGGICEYLPQETIVFDGARAEIDTQITLACDAAYIGWDFICLGRPAAGERFATGHVSQCVKVLRGGEMIWFERLCLHGGSPLQEAAYALRGQTVCGTMICVGTLREGLADLVRESMNGADAQAFSVSQLDSIVVCRYLGAQAEEGRALFTKAWDVLRLALQSRTACPPRIWAT